MLSAPRAEIAKILREIQALPTQILRECDAKRTTFSTPNTPPTRSSTAPTSCGCRNDAVQILGALTSKTQQICKLFATDPQIFERKNVHELGAERAILQRQTLRRFKREIFPRPTSRATHDRQAKMHVERAARQNRENFARNSSVADANFARVGTTQ